MDGQQDSEQDIDSVGIQLPFRLGSVSACQVGDCKILELLWEPSGSDDEVAVVAPAMNVKIEEVLSLSDAFACFGSDFDDNCS
jgi:hypothetical protein